MEEPALYPSSKSRIKIFIAAYYFIFAISLLTILHQAGFGLGNRLAQNLNSSIEYSNWATACLDITKPAELVSYLLPAICLFFYYLIAYLHLHNHIQIKQKILSHNLLFLAKNLHSPYKIIRYGIFIGVINALLLRCVGHFPNLILIAIWSVAFLAPLLFYRPYSNKLFLVNIKKYFPYLGLIMLSVVIIQIWMIFVPYLTGDILIANDYMDIPEQTIIGSKIIDNTQYINTHRIGGLLKYDPRHNENLLLPYEPDKDYIPLSETLKLRDYLQTHKNKFIYDEKYKGLFIYGELSEDEKNRLCNIVNAQECNHILRYFDHNSKLANHIYSSEQLEFVKRNNLELKNQAVAGDYFHHHHALLGSINEYSLGKPQERTMFLYGWLNTVALAKALHYFGGLSFTHYIQLTYSFYPIYITLIILAAAILFRSIAITLLIAVITITAYLTIGFKAINMAPGFNPLRHFFDIFVLLSLYFYFFSPQKKSIYLAMAIGFSFLSYLFNKEFGLFIYLGCNIAVILSIFETKNKNKIDLVILLAGIILVSYATFTLKVGNNLNALYYFTGVSIAHTHVGMINSALLLLSLIYFIAVFLPWSDSRWKYLTTYLFVYAQLSLIYFIWNPSPAHLLSFAFPWVFIFSILFLELTRKFEKTKLIIIISLILFLFFNNYRPAFAEFKKNKKIHLKIFNQHTLYSWNFPTARFTSTMDPSLFQNAVSLINKYSSSNGIYIISKYDNLLPFLAKRYSEMPFLQTDLSLVTNKELILAANTILHNQPKYIFVDSDIESNHSGNIYKLNDSITKYMDINERSIGRTLVLENLSNLFKLIKKNYSPIERGGLITVHQLNTISGENIKS